MIYESYPFSLENTAVSTGQCLASSDLKHHLRVDSTGDDEYIIDLGYAAVQKVEEITKRSLLYRTWRLTFDTWPCDEYGVIHVPRPPLISISSVTYEDSGGSSQTWSTTLYQIDTRHTPARLMPEPSQSYPTLETDRLNAVTITFTAGYSTGANTISWPRQLQYATKVLTKHWYDEQRDNVITDVEARVINDTVYRLCSPLMVKYEW